MFCDARFEIGIYEKRPAHLCVWRIDILGSIAFGFDFPQNPFALLFECLEFREMIL
jgi:hypothetical protein